MADKKISLVIEAKNGLARGLNSVTQRLSSFARSLTSFAGIGAISFASVTASIIAFGKKAIQIFAVQDKAVRNLSETLRLYGEDAATIVPRLQKVASAMQDESGVADELTMQRMANMRLMGVETQQLEMATKATAGLTRAGLGEEMAQKAVAAALNGNFEALTRYIPALKTAKTEQEKVTAVSKFMSDQWEMQKKDLQTLTGAWGALMGRVGDIWEQVGEQISNNGNIVESLNEINRSLKQLADGGYIKKFTDETVSYFSEAVDFYKTAKPYLDQISDAFKSIGIESGYQLLNPLSAMKKQFKQLGGEIGDVIEDLTGKEVSFSASAKNRDAIQKLANEEIRIKTTLTNGNIDLRTKEQLQAELISNMMLQVVRKRAMEERNILQNNLFEKRKLELDFERRMQEERVKLFIEQAKKRAKVEEDIIDIGKKIKEKETEIQEVEAEKQMQIRENALRFNLEQNKKIAAMNIAEFLREKQAEKEKEGVAQADKKKVDRLLRLSSTGAVLSKRDQAIINAQKEIEKAKDAANKQAGKLIDLARMREQKTMDGMLDVLKKMWLQQDELFKQR